MRSLEKRRPWYALPPGAVVLSILTAACSSASAVEECETLVDTYCAVWARCTTVEGDERGYRESYAQCEVVSASALACGDAESVGPRYDECLAEIAAIRCIFPFGIADDALPPSCLGVIRLK